MERGFHGVARWVTEFVGSPLATILAFLVVMLWSIGGFFFGFTDTYQLIINTGTTIITFLMVFLIQATQNRDGAAIHAKLDDIIAALDQADNRFVGVEREDIDDVLKMRDQLIRRVEGEEEANVKRIDAAKEAF